MPSLSFVPQRHLEARGSRLARPGKASARISPFAFSRLALMMQNPDEYPTIADTAPGLVVYGFIRGTDLPACESLGGISVSLGGESWIALRGTHSDALDRASWNLSEGENPKTSLIVYTVRFTDLGVSHYFKENTLSKHGGGYRVYDDLAFRTISQSGEELHHSTDIQRS